MAATGVLPFVRGVDFTKNDFKVCLKKNLVMKNNPLYHLIDECPAGVELFLVYLVLIPRPLSLRL